MTTEERFNIALKFWGYGNPDKSLFWICRIKEKGEWKCENEETEKYKDKYFDENDTVDFDNTNNPTYLGYRRFLKICFPQGTRG